MRSMLAKAVKAARLDRATYREAGKEPEAILHALGIVALVGIAYALGAAQAFVDISEAPLDLGSIGERLLGVWASIITMLFGWIIWSGLIYVTASKILGGGGAFRPTLRALGVGYGPGVLLALAPLPTVGSMISPAVLLWVLVTGVVAAHETQEIDWLGAVLAAILGWFLSFLVLPLLILQPLLGR